MKTVPKSFWLNCNAAKRSTSDFYCTAFLRTHFVSPIHEWQLSKCFFDLQYLAFSSFVHGSHGSHQKTWILPIKNSWFWNKRQVLHLWKSNNQVSGQRLSIDTEEEEELQDDEVHPCRSWENEEEKHSNLKRRRKELAASWILRQLTPLSLSFATK